MKYPKRGTRAACRVKAEPTEHQKYVQQKDNLLRGHLSYLGLPDDATWREYMCAVTSLPRDSDPEDVLPEFAELKGLSPAEMEMLNKIVSKPVLGDNIRIQSIIDLIRRKMMWLDE